MVSTKLITIIHYELLMQWRRRLLPALILVMVGLLPLGNFLVQSSTTPSQIPVIDGLDPDTVLDAPDYMQARGVYQVTVSELRSLVNAGTIAANLLFIDMLLLILAPIVFADAIALDAQFEVRAVLDSLPLNRATYLAGKLLGVWAGLLAAMLAGMLAMGLVSRLAVGAFDLRAYLAIWVFVAIVPALATTTVSVLLASTQPTRRRAILLSSALSPYYMVVGLFTMLVLFTAPTLISPLYDFLGLTQILGLSEADVAKSVAQVLGGLALSMVAAWGVAWLWLRRRSSGG